MVDGLSDESVSLNANRRRSLAPGVAAIAIGLLALAIAAVECMVSADTADIGFGTMAYVASYATAGIILIAIGVWKIYR